MTSLVLNNRALVKFVRFPDLTFIVFIGYCLAPLGNVYRGFLLFEVDAKYISLNVLKIAVISRVRSTSEIVDIFNTFDEILLVFTEKG